MHSMVKAAGAGSSVVLSSLVLFASDKHERAGWSRSYRMLKAMADDPASTGFAAAVGAVSGSLGYLVAGRLDQSTLTKAALTGPLSVLAGVVAGAACLAAAAFYDPALREEAQDMLSEPADCFDFAAVTGAAGAAGMVVGAYRSIKALK
jgi:hypothetical protein